MSETNTERKLTFGEKAVGLRFNPSKDSGVDALKKDIAEIITNLDSTRNRPVSGEVKRMLSIAITDLQTAQMWAVKALTWEE